MLSLVLIYTILQAYTNLHHLSLSLAFSAAIQLVGQLGVFGVHF